MKKYPVNQMQQQQQILSIDPIIMFWMASYKLRSICTKYKVRITAVDPRHIEVYGSIDIYINVEDGCAEIEEYSNEYDYRQIRLPILPNQQNQNLYTPLIDYSRDSMNANEGKIIMRFNVEKSIEKVQVFLRCDFFHDVFYDYGREYAILFCQKQQIEHIYNDIEQISLCFDYRTGNYYQTLNLNVMDSISIFPLQSINSIEKQYNAKINLTQISDDQVAINIQCQSYNNFKSVQFIIQKQIKDSQELTQIFPEISDDFLQCINIQKIDNYLKDYFNEPYKIFDIQQLINEAKIIEDYYNLLITPYIEKIFSGKTYYFVLSRKNTSILAAQQAEIFLEEQIMNFNKKAEINNFTNLSKSQLQEFLNNNMTQHIQVQILGISNQSTVDLEDMNQVLFKLPEISEKSQIFETFYNDIQNKEEVICLEMATQIIEDEQSRNKFIQRILMRANLNINQFNGQLIGQIMVIQRLQNILLRIRKRRVFLDGKVKMKGDKIYICERDKPNTQQYLNDQRFTFSTKKEYTIGILLGFPFEEIQLMNIHFNK